MSIKNYFVRGEKLGNNVTGVKYANYLTSRNHPNHLQTKIVEIYNSSKKWIELVTMSAAKINAQKSIKGGRPTKRYGHSFACSIPAGSPHPSKDQWKEITANLVNTLSIKLKVDKKVLIKHCYIVAHNQNNPHIHILVGSVINGTTYNQQLSSERTTYALKQAFNYSCYKTLGLNHLDHKPLIKGDKRISRIKYEKKLLTNLQKYFKKWLEASLTGNEKQNKRQFNRIVKSLAELDQSNKELADSFIKDIELHIPTINTKIRGPNYE
jgi:hypothetical protein